MTKKMQRLSRVLALIYKWVIFSVLLQVFLLLFVNNYYLANRGAVIITKEEQKADVKKDKKFVIPQASKDLRVSYDGAYAAYIVDNYLEIVDLGKKKVLKKLDSKTEDLIYFKWLPDRHMIIYALKGDESDLSRIQITTHDIDSGLDRSYPEITKLPKQSEVAEIQLSPLTNVVYVKINTSFVQSVIYKYNIMDNLSYVMNTSILTVIKETNYSDKLIYQDEKNRLFVRDGIRNTVRPISFKYKMVLLGIASEDKVFVGELDDNNRVFKIHCGKLPVEPDKAWDQITLKRPARPQDLIISHDDSIYKVVKEESAVYNIKENKRIDYTGDYVEIVNGYIVTLKEGELKLDLIH